MPHAVEQGRPAPPQADMPRRGVAVLLLVALIVLPVVFYFPTLTAGFGGDEEIMYVWETKVRRLSDITRLFTIDIYKVWQRRHYAYDVYASSGDYRPVSYLSVAVLSRFFGFYAPAYQVIALLIYSLGTLLVLLLVYRLTHNPPLAWLTAGLFAVEPSRVGYQTVIYLGGTVVVFYLTSALSYIAARTTVQSSSRNWLYGFSLLAALMASFSHELAFSLPFILLLLEGWGGLVTRQWAFRPAFIVPYGLIAGFYVVTRTIVTSRFHANTSLLQPTDLRDMVAAGLHTVSRLVMLFVPTPGDPLHIAKMWLFGDVPSRTILTVHPGLMVAAAGLLVGAAALMIWPATRPHIRRFLRHDEQGQWCLLALGWSLTGVMIPLILLNYVALKHLVLVAVGADLLKALGIVVLSERLFRRWAWDRWWVAAGLLTPLLLYSVTFIVQSARNAERGGRLTQVLSADAVRLIREASASGGVDDRPMIVYLLNAGGDSASVGIQEVVQAALGRDNIRVVTPYMLGWGGPDNPYDHTHVTIGRNEILVANNPQRPHYIFLIDYALSKIVTGLRFRNGDLYTVEVMEAEDIRHNPLRLVIRYARPEGTHVLFLKREHDRLVRRDPPEAPSASGGEAED